MTIKTKVFSDYVCPSCFLAEFPIEVAIKEKDVEAENVAMAVDEVI